MKSASDQLAHAAMLAWGRLKRSQSCMWSEWMTFGEGLLAGRRWAMHQAGTNKPEGKGYVLAFNEWLRRWKVHDLDKSDRAKLLQLMEERPAVEEWRASLTSQEQRELNNPTVVWRRWKTLERPRRSRSPPDGARLRRTNEQLQARVRELEERVRELEEELAATRANTVETQEKNIRGGNFENQSGSSASETRPGEAESEPILKMAED